MWSTVFDRATTVPNDQDVSLHRVREELLPTEEDSEIVGERPTTRYAESITKLHPRFHSPSAFLTNILHINE
jgi:hypothetical protein